MKNINAKLKFKKETNKLRDTFLFLLIFVLCAATIVTIQLKSKNNSDTADTVSETETFDYENEAETEEFTQNQEEIFPDEKEFRPKTEQANDDNDDADITDTEMQVQTAANENTEPQNFNFEAPCSGKIIQKFSDSELLYSKTLDDWRIHLGVDIATPIGTEILACEGGIVEEITNDAELGNTVVIRHNNIFTKYSNLASEKLPVKGNKVDKGDVIGVVGDSAGTEITEDAHLHFAMCEDNIFVDPNKYINFQNE